MAYVTPRFLLIEGSDFIDFPMGGQLSVSRSLITAFGSDLALVGWARKGEQVGRWTRRIIDGTTIVFFPFASPDRSRDKPLVPHRVTTYVHLQRFRKAIAAMGCTAAFMLAPETLLATSGWGLDSICFNLSGVSPVLSGRYRWSKYVSGLLEESYITALNRADVLLASADRQAMQEFAARAHGRLARKRMIQWPTRVDTDVFRPADRAQSRRALGLAERDILFVCCGRISEEKGWRLVLEAFLIFQRTTPESRMIFVGTGEDRRELEDIASKHGLAERVIVTGALLAPEVAVYMNAANAIVVGSFVEGWSVAMVEALACGRPVVSTAVSGAADMIVQGENGLIVAERSAENFAGAMQKVLMLGDCSKVSRKWAEALSLSRLRSNLEAVWPAIR